MRCDVCGSSDSVFFTRPDVMGGDLHLCKACAVASGYADGGTGYGEGEPAPACPTCGLTAERLRLNGRLGCSDCAKTFRHEILSILRKSGRTGHYEGKVPSYTQKKTAPEEAARTLSLKLEAAIHAEDFEAAAQIRDALRGIAGSESP